uniref:cAMP-responsive element modulator n=1 Tax=Zonotrichia albicollis TaxID=44394 RepID=A0A8D2NHV3_ZONAL
VQLPSGQTVHVQGVIQATQPSVIQSPHMQAVQVASIADEAAQSEVIIDSQKRREILSRRPSYRKILNELSSDAPAVAKIEEEEKSEDEGTPSGISAVAMPTSLYHTNTGQYLTISQGGTIQTVTNSGAPQPGATIVQYAAQSSDGTQQFFSTLFSFFHIKQFFLKCFLFRVDIIAPLSKILIARSKSLRKGFRFSA